MVLEEDVAALGFQHRRDRLGEHAEKARQVEMAVNLVVQDRQLGADGIAHRRDIEDHRVALPVGADVAAARQMLVKLVDIVANPLLGGVLAELVREVDVDRLAHFHGVAVAEALFKSPHGSIIARMRTALLTLAMLTSPASAQTAIPAPAVATPGLPPVADPAAAYITAGQDEPGYRSWYLAAPWRPAQVKQFNDYLGSAGVDGIVPTWQLFRTATSWAECGGQPFEVPPTSEWPHIIQTLRYIRDFVIPAIGPVEPVSVYRNPTLNKCAGGAPDSAHMHDSAIDMVPLKPTNREELMKTLCATHSEHGEAYGTGLGFYAFLRFHVDSSKFRRWNMDPAVAALCPAIVHPSDVASVGQPLPAPAATAATPADPTGTGPPAPKH